jgi:hypothetical protein
MQFCGEWTCNRKTESQLLVRDLRSGKSKEQQVIDKRVQNDD